MKANIFYIFVLSILYTQNIYSQNTCTICDKLKNNVVTIHTTFDDESDENGFGIVIAEKNNKLYIVTAKHVIYNLEGNGLISLNKKTRSVTVKFLSDLGKDYPAILLHFPPTVLDIGLLEVKKPDNYLWEKDFYSTTIERGTPVWFIGREGGWYIPTGSSVGSVNEISTDDEILIDITSIEPGTSGAPLLSENGIVGLIFEDAASGARAYPIEKVRKLITGPWNYPWQMNLNSKTVSVLQPDMKGCSIAGKVFNQDNNQPLSGVQVSFYHFEENAKAKSSKEVKPRVATTGPDGSFKADCKGIADSSFPLRIVLWHPDWEATLFTFQKIELGDERTDINMPVNISSLLKHPPKLIPKSIAEGPIGKVIRIESNGASHSYDFRTGIVGPRAAEGDFYLSGLYPSFWANNRGQGGLVDLGAIRDRLDQIVPPVSGYTKQGVDAIVGHVYVALARQGYENDHIIFRVLDIGVLSDNPPYYDANDKTEYYQIQYYYRDN